MCGETSFRSLEEGLAFSHIISRHITHFHIDTLRIIIEDHIGSFKFHLILIKHNQGIQGQTCQKSQKYGEGQTYWHQVRSQLIREFSYLVVLFSYLKVILVFFFLIPIYLNLNSLILFILRLSLF